MPTPTIRFRVDFGRRQAVGPGKIALLERIGQTGSLSRAARDLHMSYRRAWLLLESLNASFRERVAVSSRGGRGGGGVRLTVFGHRLISVYREFEVQMQARAARMFRPIAGKVRTARGAAPVRRLQDRDARKRAVRKSVARQ
jgi:molybdate transport system regulatory protein